MSLEKYFKMCSKRIFDEVKQEISKYKPFCDETLLVYDLSEIKKKVQVWEKSLSNITPYYAVKANSDKVILKYMDSLGLKFDCASKHEIELIENLKVATDRIIYANPCKQISHISYANKRKVSLTTVDSICELEKLALTRSNMEILIRLATDDSKAICPMSDKYGVYISEISGLLLKAKELNLNVVGYAFHVGSASEDPLAFSKAILLTNEAFAIAENLGFNLNILDIGGGFPGKADNLFQQLVKDLTDALQNTFSKPLKLIAEPGRFLVDSSATLFCSVIGVRKVSNDHIRYYLSDGVYGILSSLIYDHALVDPKVLFKDDRNEIEEGECSLWGPSCDGFDCILKRVTLPKLYLGDLVYFQNIGAYSVANSTQFNGLNKPKILYLN